MSDYNYENITGSFLTITNELNELMNYVENEGKESSADLSLKERREHINNLFDILEAIENFKQESTRLKQRLESFIGGLRKKGEANDERYQAKHNESDNNSSIPIQDNETVPSVPEPGIHESNDTGNTQYTGAAVTTESLKPVQVIFDGKRYGVKDWSDVMTVICQAIISDSPKMVDRLIDSPFNMMEDQQPLFSYHWQVSKSPRMKITNRLYVRTGLEIEKSPDIYYQIINLCGYSSNDLKILYSPENPEQNKIN